MLFLDFLFQLRQAGLPVGTGEWLTFLQGLRRGLVTEEAELYRFGRAVLCRSEADYDAYDLAYAATFGGLELPEDVRQELARMLRQALEGAQGTLPEQRFDSQQALWEAFLKKLREQTELHRGGNQHIGTRGTSAFGHGGRNRQGIRHGGDPQGGGGRQGGVATAEERRYEHYRGDRELDIRDLSVVLRALRNLARDGRWELDLDDTIDQTARNAGDLEIVERRERKNRLEVVLLMDAGGSMRPHAERVEKLFSAAKKTSKHFKSLDFWFFHNCPYGFLYKDMAELARTPTDEVLTRLTPRHRLVFVGDASMAPYELMSDFSWGGQGVVSGLEWLKRFKAKAPASVWLNPDDPKWWNHPTVSAIGQVFPMFELTVDGLKDAVKKLRAPH